MSDLDFLPCVFFLFVFFLIFHVSICSFSTRNRTQNTAGRFKRAALSGAENSCSHLGPISLSEMCDPGQGWCPLSLFPHLQNGSNGRAFLGCVGRRISSIFPPFTICPQPSAPTLVTGFLGCRLYLIEEETKAEGIDVHSSCSMATARHSGDCKMMSSHQQHRALGAATVDPAMHSLSSTTVPGQH